MGSVVEPGDWVNPGDKGENSQEKNGMMMMEEAKKGRGGTRKENEKCQFAPAT